jgi:drug/metabolite transporter (DMT)-like permease
MNGRLYGVLLVATSTILWSTAGFFVRLLPLDLWTMIGWRSLFAFLSLLVVVVLMRGREGLRLGRSLGLPGLVAVPLAATSMISYIAAVKLTTVANVMTVYATVPFVAAGIAFVLMRERVGRDVLVTAGIGFVGVLIMAGFARGRTDLLGDASAFLMTVSFATTVVMARRWPRLDLTMVTALASGLCAFVCLALASRTLPAPSQLVLLFVFSLATQSISYLLFLMGGREIPSAEAGLVGLLDVVLGPLWVWLAFAERPSPAALVGGALTLFAVLLYLTQQLRRGSLAKA